MLVVYLKILIEDAPGLTFLYKHSVFRILLKQGCWSENAACLPNC